MQLLTHRKSHVAFLLAYLQLTVAHSKGQGQGHAHFACEYLANDDRQGKYYYCPKYYVASRFRLAYFELTLTYSEGQLSRRNGVFTNILAFLS